MNNPVTATRIIPVRCAQQRMHGESPCTKPSTTTAAKIGPAASASTANASATSGSERVVDGSVSRMQPLRCPQPFSRSPPLSPQPLALSP